MSGHDSLCPIGLSWEGWNDCVCKELRQAREQERKRMAAAIENLPTFEEAGERTTVLLSDVQAAFEGER